VSFKGLQDVVEVLRVWTVDAHDEVQCAIRDCVAEAVKAQVTRDSADPAPLWALTCSGRSAAWMIRHRPPLENAITA
jgi:hypothetical protein